MGLNSNGGKDKLNPGVDLTERIPENKLNSSSLEGKNADYRFNMTRLREEEQVLAGKLAELIKSGGENDLKKYIIGLGVKGSSPILQHDSVPKDTIEFTSSGMLGNEYQFKAKDGSMHPDMGAVNRHNDKLFRESLPYMAQDGSRHPDMEGVQKANSSYWDSVKFTPQDKYIIPVLPKEDLKIFLKNPK